MSGVEVVGAVASIGQLLDLGLRSAKFIIEFCDDWRNGSRKASQRLDTVRHLQQILSALAAEPDLNLRLVVHSIESMVTKLVKLETVLGKLHPGSRRTYRRIINCMSNQMREKELKELLDDLERDKTTFLLLLSCVNIRLQQKLNSVVPLQPAATNKHAFPVGNTCLDPIERSNTPLWSTPATSVPQFVGQTHHLSFMNNLFLESLEEKRVMVLSGPAGAGKSQLALKFCLDKQNNGTNLLWIDCSSHRQACNSFVAAAGMLHEGVLCKQQCLQPRQAISYVKNFLATTENRWIAVFDNWDDLYNPSDVLSLVPASCSGFILITSRHPETMRLGTSIEINGMTEDDATGLLFAKTQVQHQDQVKTTGQQIVLRLGCLPLAIDQASSYIKTMGISLEQFLQYYEANMAQVLNYIPSIWEYQKYVPTETEYRSISIYNTWELAFMSFAGDQPRVSNLMSIIGFLCRTSVNEALFQTFFEMSTGPCGIRADISSRRTLLDTLSQFGGADGHWDRRAFSNMITTLREKRLLEATSVMSNGSLSLSLHPLISDWLRIRQTEEQKGISFRQACDLVRCVIETKHSEVDCSLEFWQLLVAHVDTLLVHWNTVGITPEAELYSGVLAFSSFYFRRGHYHSAVEASQILLKQLGSASAQDSPSRFEAMHWQACSYHRLGEYRLAEISANEAVKGFCQYFGDAAPATIAAKAALADLYRSRAAYIEAEAIYVDIVACLSTVFGEFHQQTISALAKLAVVLVSQGKAQDACDIYEKIREHFWMNGQEPDFAMIWIKNDYATFLKSQGRFEEAQLVYEVVLAMRTKCLGLHHHDTLWTLVDYADNLKSQSKYDESRRVYKDAIDHLKEQLGELHPETLWASDGLGDLYAKTYQLQKAEEILSWVLQARVKALGGCHHNTMRTMHNLANVYFLQGRVELSRVSYEIALEGLIQSLGPHHSKTERVRTSLAKVLNARMTPERSVESLEFDIGVEE